VILVIANLKGGPGKTTTTAYLAAAASRRGRPVLIGDADASSGISEWMQEWINNEWVSGVQVAGVPSVRLLNQLVTMPLAAEEVLIIDTPPNSDHLMVEAMNHADVIVIPTRVGGGELSRVQATLSLAPATTPRGIVICSARSGTKDLASTTQGWQALGESIWGVIPERVGIAAGLVAPPFGPGVDAYDLVLNKAVEMMGVKA
jgi:chromosome partitioning protein